MIVTRTGERRGPGSYCQQHQGKLCLLLERRHQTGKKFRLKVPQNTFLSKQGNCQVETANRIRSFRPWCFTAPSCRRILSNMKSYCRFLKTSHCKWSWTAEMLSALNECLLGVTKSHWSLQELQMLLEATTNKKPSLQLELLSTSEDLAFGLSSTQTLKPNPGRLLNKKNLRQVFNLLN